MTLEFLNGFYLLGIILMLIASVQTGRVTAKLRIANERRRKRMDAAYGGHD